MRRDALLDACCLFSAILLLRLVVSSSGKESKGASPKQKPTSHSRSINLKLSAQQHSNSHHSYVCTAEEKKFQFDNADLVVTNICDTETPWRLAQLALPEATVFLDVGGNRGYTSAMIFGLWSPGHGFNRKNLKDWTVNSGENMTQPDTVCGDGLLDDTPMLCPGLHKHQILTGSYKCSFRRSIKVFAFDGQQHHVESVKKIVYANRPLLLPNTSAKHSPGTKFGKQSLVKASWEYNHFALTR
jgi:hypothetical protein